MLTKSLGRAPTMLENVIKYKTDYPAKLVDFLYSACGFSWESVIADIGSGTGTFTRLLLERGSRVVAIEPNQALRETAERILEDEFPRFVSLEATAENTTLSDSSIHHIVCAQSFHFCNPVACRQEFWRILKPGGWVVLIRSKPSGNDEFALECEALIKKYSKKMCGTGGDIDTIYSTFFDHSEYTSFSLSNQFTLDFDGLMGRLFSCFNLPRPGEEGHDGLIEELGILFELYQESGKVPYRYDIGAYAGRLDGAN